MSETLQAYCVKCKTKRDMDNPRPVYNQNGTPGTKGTCPVCGTSLFRMGATEAHADLPKPVRTATSASSAKKSESKKPAKKSAKTAPKRSTSGRGGKLVIV